MSAPATPSPPPQRSPGTTPPRSLDYRILAIDGGGIRGVIPALLLAALERELGARLQELRADPLSGDITGPWKGIEIPRIADCFHLIAGTSTGGLIAAGLTATTDDGRPKLSADQVAGVYQRYGAKIFHRPLWRNIFDHWNLIWPKYPLKQLRKVMAQPSLLGDTRLKRARTEVLLIAYDVALPGPRYYTRFAAIPERTMVQVACATAAAPTYFEPEKFDHARLVDGGVYAGNPALAAIGMALRRGDADPAFADARQMTPRDLFMVSLGTGRWSAPLDSGSGGIAGWLWPRNGGEPLIEAMLGGSADFADEVSHMLLNGTPPDESDWTSKLWPWSVGAGPQMWRYQPRLPAPYGLDDDTTLPALEAIANNQIKRYTDELKLLAKELIAVGPVPPLSARKPAKAAAPKRSGRVLPRRAPAGTQPSPAPAAPPDDQVPSAPPLDEPPAA